MVAKWVVGQEGQAGNKPNRNTWTKLMGAK